VIHKQNGGWTASCDLCLRKDSGWGNKPDMLDSVRSSGWVVIEQVNPKQHILQPYTMVCDECAEKLGVL